MHFPPRRYLWTLIPAAAALGLALFWWFSPLRRGWGMETFRYLPANGALTVHFDLAGLRGNPLIRNALKNQEKIELARDYARFVEATGFNFETDLDSLSATMTGPPGARMIHAVLSGRFRRERFDAHLAGHRIATENYGGRTIDEFIGPSGRHFRVAFLSRGRLAFSNAPGPAAIHSMVDLARGQGESLLDRLNELAVANHVPAGAQGWLALDMERAGSLSVPTPFGGGAVSFTTDLLRGSRLVLVSARLGEASAELKLAAEYSSGSEAQRVANQVAGLRALLSALAEREKDQNEVQRALDQLSIGVENKAAIARLTLPSELIQQLLQATMAPAPEPTTPKPAQPVSPADARKPIRQSLSPGSVETRLSAAQ